MPSVYLHSTKDPRDVVKLLRNIRAEKCFKPDEKILIKPNYVTDDMPYNGVTVDPLIVVGIVVYLQDHGFNNIIVAEGGIVGYDMESVFDRVGLTYALKPYGIAPVDLNSDEVVEVIIEDATALKKVTVAKTYLEADAIISVSKLKVHSLASVTLCMKNMMGGLIPKNIMHNRIHEKIVDLNRRFRPRLSIIDGVIGNQFHETECCPVASHIIIGGTDVVAVDTVGAYLLNRKPTEVEYLMRANTAGLGECRMEKITIVGGNAKELRRHYDKY